MTFYDPTRLAHDVQEEIASHRFTEFRRVIVVDEVTAEQMTHAAEALRSDFFT